MSIKPNPYESIRRISEVARSRHAHLIQCLKKAESGKYQDILDLIQAGADMARKEIIFYCQNTPESISNLTTLRTDGFSMEYKNGNLLYVSIRIP